MEQNTMSGRHIVLMDARGRISFPSEYRADIGEWLYISPDQSNRNYLVARSEAGYQAELLRVGEEAGKLWEGEEPELIQDAVEDARSFFSSSTSKVTPDKNGRITINEELKSYAGLEDRVAVIGVGSYVQIWREDKWNAHRAAMEEERKRRRAKLDANRRAKLAAEHEA